jgi:hypothetical protein
LNIVDIWALSIKRHCGWAGSLYGPDEIPITIEEDGDFPFANNFLEVHIGKTRRAR